VWNFIPEIRDLCRIADQQSTSLHGVSHPRCTAVVTVPPEDSPVIVSRFAQWTVLGSVVALAAVLVVGGCGNGRLVLPMTLDAGSLARPGEVARLTSHEAAVRGIASVLVNDLGLPVPEEVTVYVYASRRVFEQGLVQDAHVSPARAAELSDFAIGVGRRRQLLFNDEAYTQKGREWLRLVAHELAHVSQFELAQGEGRAAQWLAEGMAEWVAFAVLERFGLDTMDRRREVARSGIRSHAALVDARLDLEAMGSPRGFTVRHLRDGSLPTYQLAFLMADYLIARDGLPAVIEYFRVSGERGTRREHFRRAFGQSIDDFEREVTDHLLTLVR
jgi:hypothetical protein